jgi:rhodanese-related sulfurtransferase
VRYSPPIIHRDDAVTAPADVRQALLAGTEIALVDVRPEGPFAAGHPLFAASLPLGQLEAEVLSRLPRRSVPVVVYGAGGPDVAAAIRRLRQLGYSRVSALEGGLDGWTAAGGELFGDVNAPSKAFGELVSVRAGTPSIPARELAELIAAGQAGGPGSPACVVVDARRFDEFAVMSIPTATSVPGAELVLRARALAPDPATTIVVNCAGRTRSIIGTQSLINARIPNRVVALANGTIGWTLAGLELDHGRQRRAPEVAAEAAARAQDEAWTVAARAGVRRGTAADLAAPPDDGGRADGGRADGGRADGDRTVYRFDVRSPEEYAAGHLPGFRSAPGGQLVQETDRFAPVRGALLVLEDDGGGRAAMTASWLAQMNWDVVVAAADPSAPRDTGDWAPVRPPAPRVPLPGPATVERWLRAGTVSVIDVGSSTRFRTGHLPGAAWALRADLPELLRGPAGRRPIVLTSADGYLAAWSPNRRSPKHGSPSHRSPSHRSPSRGSPSHGAGGGRPRRAGHRPGGRDRRVGPFRPPPGDRRRAALAGQRRLPPPVRGHRRQRGRHAGLPGLGIRPRRAAGARRHPWLHRSRPLIPAGPDTTRPDTSRPRYQLEGKLCPDRSGSDSSRT